MVRDVFARCNEDIAARQGREVPDIRFKTVLADKQHRDAAALAGQCVNIKCEALAVGNQQDVACAGGSHRAGKRVPDFRASRRVGQSSDQRKQPLPSTPFCRAVM